MKKIRFDSKDDCWVLNITNSVFTKNGAWILVTFLIVKFQVVLWSASGIYFFAFFSLYHQLPGLYSDNGVLPVHSALQISSKISPFSQFKEKKNLLVFTKYLEITIYDGMELLCIFGTVLSTLMMITKKLRNTLSFILLYICYLSCYKEIF